MPSSLELARQQWEEGFRRLEGEARDRRRHAGLLEQVEAVSEELRRRVGATFTLAELAEAYGGAERWAGDAVSRRSPGPGWARSLVAVTDAAFHLYARGARDYRP